MTGGVRLRGRFAAVTVTVVLLTALTVLLRPGLDEPPRRVSSHDAGAPEIPPRAPPPTIAQKDRVGRTPQDNREPTIPAIRGTVTLLGRPLPAATVYAFLRSDEPAYDDTPSGVTTTADDGRYELRLPPRSRTIVADVGALGPGACRQLRTDLAIPGNTVVTIDFALLPGSAISGRVVDTTGTPVSGVVVLATRKPTVVPVAHMFVSPALLDTESLRLAPRNSDYHEAHCATDDAGEFRLEGLAPGPYTLVLRSFAWILSSPHAVEAPREGAVLVAEPSRSIAGHVVDAQDQTPIPRFAVEVVHGEHPFTLVGTSFDGELRLAWRPKASYGSTAELQVRANGYEPARVPLAFSTQTGEIQVGTIGLKRLGSARVEIDVHHENGEPCRLELCLDLGEPQGGRFLSLTLTAESDSLYSTVIPAGHWFARIRPASAFARSVEWRGELHAEPSAPSKASALLPRAGKLRVRRPGANDEQGWSLLGVGESIAAQVMLESKETVVDVAPGPWVFSVHRGEAIVREVTMDVHASSEHAIDLD